MDTRSRMGRLPPRRKLPRNTTSLKTIRHPNHRNRDNLNRLVSMASNKRSSLTVIAFRPLCKKAEEVTATVKVN